MPKLLLETLFGHGNGLDTKISTIAREGKRISFFPFLELAVHTQKILKGIRFEQKNGYSVLLC